ncbi:hypothetical protein FOCC_FOCC013080, partial [Frankliniella occidentalis]
MSGTTLWTSSSCRSSVSTPASRSSRCTSGTSTGTRRCTFSARMAGGPATMTTTAVTSGGRRGSCIRCPSSTTRTSTSS